MLVLGIAVGLVIAALPFLWMAVSSLGTAGMVIRIGFTWDMFNPLNWSLEPYLIAWKMAGISRYIQTTTIYAGRGDRPGDDHLFTGWVRIWPPPFSRRATFCSASFSRR